MSAAPIAVAPNHDVIVEVFGHGMRYVRRRLRYAELFTAEKMYIGLDVSVEVQRRTSVVDHSTLTIEKVAVSDSAVETASVSNEGKAE